MRVIWGVFGIIVSISYTWEFGIDLIHMVGYGLGYSDQLPSIDPSSLFVLLGWGVIGNLSFFTDSIKRVSGNPV